MYYVICAASIAMIGFYGAFQHLKRQPKRRKALTIACKCAATGMAVLVGVLGAARSGLPSNWVMTAGLIACMLADGLLCVRFMVGGAVFAVGHLLYIIAFCMMNRPGWGSLALFIALILLATWLFSRFRTRVNPKRFFPAYAYATVLCVMVALAAAQRPMFLAGAALFAFSDATLAYLGMMEHRSRRLDNISLGAYFTGQFLLALALII